MKKFSIILLTIMAGLTISGCQSNLPTEDTSNAVDVPQQEEQEVQKKVEGITYDCFKYTKDGTQIYTDPVIMPAIAAKCVNETDKEFVNFANYEFLTDYESTHVDDLWVTRAAYNAGLVDDMRPYFVYNGEQPYNGKVYEIYEWSPQLTGEQRDGYDGRVELEVRVSYNWHKIDEDGNIITNE